MKKELKGILIISSVAVVLISALLFWYFKTKNKNKLAAEDSGSNTDTGIDDNWQPTVNYFDYTDGPPIYLETQRMGDEYSAPISMTFPFYIEGEADLITEYYQQGAAFGKEAAEYKCGQRTTLSRNYFNFTDIHSAYSFRQGLFEGFKVEENNLYVQGKCT